MKRSRFRDEQILGVLREHDAGASVGEVCRRPGRSTATFDAWKAKFGGLEVSEAKRLYADAMLDNTALKDLLARKW